MSRMAESQDGPSGMIMSHIDGIQAGLREALAADAVTLNEEIESRILVAQYLHERFRTHQRPKDLADAIEHLEVVVRRLPQAHPELPKVLDQLCYMKVSDYGLHQSIRSLNEAIDLGLKAKDIALQTGLPKNDPDGYFEILNNLGYAQSHRYGELQRPQDLDDSVTSAQEVLHLAPKDSHEFRTAIVNLASRIRLRYKARRNAEDAERALRLIEEQLEASKPGGILRALMLFQLGEVFYDKFRDSGDLEDLDKALEHGEACAADVPKQHEKRAIIVGRLCNMWGDRYEKTKDLADAENVLLYSQMRVWTLPPDHTSTGTHIWEHMLYLRIYVRATSDLPAVDNAVEQGKSVMKGMRDEDPRREACQWIYGDLLGRRYELSGSLDYLIQFVENNKTIGELHDERMAKEGGEMLASWKIRSLLRSLGKIAKAPDDSQMKVSVCNKLRAYFRAACDASGVPNAPIAMHNASGAELEVLAEAIELNPYIDEAEAEQKTKSAETERRGDRETSKKKPIWRPQEYHTEFGVRSLAIDLVGDKEIVVNLPNIVCDVFGYKDLQPLSLEDGVRQEMELERDTREMEEKGGKNPNPSLCRACRKLKVLKPSADGFTWNESVKYVPYGNYFQLLCRRHCSICSLLLSLVSTDDLNLLPRLAAIDHEIQGTSVEPVKLASGEVILQVNYGLRYVGALRVVNKDYDHQVTEDMLQIEDDILGFMKNENRLVSSRNHTVPLSRVKKWLSNCDHNHGRRCNDSRVSSEIAMIHIDVIDDCLIHTTSKVKYFALSYVWGKASMAQTIRSNTRDRLQKGGFASVALPKTIQDAMVLVKELGERYLWVDALCIIQDDDEKKQQDIEQMDIVYSQAFATIVAMDGLDADSGLSGVRIGTRSPKPMNIITVSNKSTELAYIPQSESNEKISVVATPTTLSLALYASKWNSRAWTMQERLLSKRCLYFTKECVYFQCSTGLMNETDVNEPLVSHASSTLNNPLLALHQPKEIDKKEGCRRSFGAYKSLVEKYTLRELSFLTDVLNAFAGVSAVLGQHLPGGMLCGLPAAFLDLAILWTPAKPMKRRLGLSKAPETGGYAYPTWSWAGYIGPVEYRLFMADEAGPLPTPLVEKFQIYQNGAEVCVLGSRHPTIPQATHESVHPEITRTNQVDPTIAPTILTFEALVVPITAFKVGDELQYLSLQEHIHTSGQQAVSRVYDKNEVHCGLCFTIPTAVPAEDDKENSLFVAISEATLRNYCGKYSGLTRVEGGVTPCDMDVYGKESAKMINALLITGADVAERISVARIHVNAWEGAMPTRRLVRLG